MQWPARREFWGDLWDRALADYASVANTVAAFEPVLMVADPTFERDARSRCGEGVDILEMPIDDSWARDIQPESTPAGPWIARPAA
jgi:agmatine deiminase